MVTAEERLSSIEAAIVQIIDLNTNLAQSQANHLAHIGALERRADAMERRADAMERWADAMEQSLDSVKRFERQTRRLWIMIAQKVDWLDEDDLDRWKKEDL